MLKNDVLKLIKYLESLLKTTKSSADRQAIRKQIAALKSLRYKL